VFPFSTASLTIRDQRHSATSAITYRGGDRSFNKKGQYPHSWTSIFILYTSWSARFSPLYSIHPHPSILYIILYPLYSLWDPFVTLSKYIHVWSSFERFIETNLMVQSKFNLDFWFVSYSIFSLCLALYYSKYRVREMIEYRFRVSSTAVFTLYSHSNVLEYRFRVPTAVV
jgi:hypothetical protein